ncbi:MAG: filamentous hemagglutinin N-terminal domain-containing protein, partial [Elainellaceae cyanobacterium]
TLGDERSQVSENFIGLPIEIITGGAQRGQNLFHSFEEFNISAGRTAFFDSPEEIDNIFSRVTGANPSNILGTLGTFGGTADVFLINPNGIVFGPDANLSVGGSFFATTGSHLLFEDGFTFSTSASDGPSLLTISVPIGLAFQGTPQPITNRSTAIGLDGTPGGLEILPGNTLALIGGDVILTDGGRLTAPGGRVDIGGLTTAGTVGFAENENGTLVLTFPDTAQRSNVTLLNESRINVRGQSGGDIAVNAGTFSLTNGSGLALGPVGNGDGGDATINADTVRFSGVGPSGFGSGISNITLPGSSGNAGDTIINARTIVFDGDRDFMIPAQDLGFETGIQSQTAPGATGDAGDVIVNAETFRATSNSGLRSLASAGSLGATGTVTVNADVVDLSTLSFIEAVALNEQATGSVAIDTDRLSLQGGSSVSTTVSASGTGTVDIKAAEIDVLGVSSEGIPSNISSFTNGLGRAGALVVNTQNLRIRDGALLGSTGIGLLQSTTGSSGDITIVANNAVELSGQSSVDGTASGSLISTLTSTEGPAGNISITTGLLTVTDGGRINTSTSSLGRAGRLNINADTVQILGGTDLVPSGFSSGTLGAGNGNTITISARQLQISDGAQIITRTGGLGDAGSVIIDVGERVTFAGAADNGISVSRASSEVGIDGAGRGGNIKITTAVLEVLDGAELAASTFGRGDAGNITITASDRVIFSGNANEIFRSRASSRVELGAVDADGGDIRITAPVLRVSNGARLEASSAGDGNAGRVVVRASDRTVLDGESDLGFSSGIFTLTTETATGTGGAIRLNTSELQVTDGAVVNARTGNGRSGGSIRIEAEEVGILRGGQVITTALASGRAGDITLITDAVRLTGHSDRVASLSTNPGDLDFAVDNEGLGQSGLFADTREGSSGPGGTIMVRTNRLTLSDRSIISAQSDGEGIAGDLVLNVRDRFEVINSDVTTTAPEASGGDVFINAASNAENSLTTLEGDSDITTNSLGNGGNITIGGSAIIAFDDSDIISSSGAANGGNITLTRFLSEPTPPGNAVDFDGNNQVDLNASGALSSGTITAPDTSFLQNSLADLPEGILNTESLIAGSCVARNEDGSSSFNITGAEGLRDRPGNATTGYDTGDAQPIPEEGWQPGDPIVEPQSIYQLPNGELVLSHACQQP